MVFDNSTPSQARRHHREQLGRLVTIVLEAVREVGVEGDAVSGSQLVALTDDGERRRPLQDHGRLATPRLVDRWIVHAAGRRPGTEPVERDVGPLAGKRRCQLLDAMAAAPSSAPLAAAHDDDVAILVEAQKLRQAEVEPRGYARGDGQRRTRLPALDL